MSFELHRDYNLLQNSIIVFGLLCLTYFLPGLSTYYNKLQTLCLMAKQRRGPSALPFIGSIFYFVGAGNDILKALSKLYKEYETPVPVWLGRKLYFVISDPEDMEIILNSPHAQEKHGIVHKFLNFFMGSGLFTAPVSKWKPHRKIITPAFNQIILKEYVGTFSEHSEILVKNLLEKAKEGVIDAHQYVHKSMTDLFCDTTIGLKVDGELPLLDFNRWLIRGLEILEKRLNNILYYSDFIFNITFIGRELKRLAEKGQTTVENVIEEKKKLCQNNLSEADQSMGNFESGKRIDLLDHFIKLNVGDEKLTDDELRDEVNTVLATGIEMSTKVISTTLVMLGMQPEIQAKVYEEVIDVLGPDRPVKYEDLQKLQYTERVLKETMRLFPVEPVFARNLTQAITLEKCALPNGSTAVLDIFAMQRKSKIWSNPLKFDPDRFLPEQEAIRHPYSWLPFSAGPRNCIGMNFAYMSMKTVIASIIRKCLISSDYKSIEDINVKMGMLLKLENGYKISIQLRE